MNPVVQAAVARPGFAIGRDQPWRTDEVVRAWEALGELETLVPNARVTRWVQVWVAKTPSAA